jgi:hypothetical protein
MTIILGDSTGEESTLDEIDLLQEIRELTLSSILSKIFSEMLFESIRHNFLELKFETSEEIINNEITIWISTLESMYPSISKKIQFLKPDYNQTEFYTMQYKFDSSKVNIDEILA